MSVDGAIQLTVLLDGEHIGGKSMLFKDGQVAEKLHATIPLKAGVFGGSAEVRVEIAFDPPVRPYQAESP